MTETPLISVIIPTRNMAHFVVDAVRSALAQTHPRVEVIVVDDGSTDGTREALAPYMASLKYVPQEHRGLSASRNHALREATGELVAFLDADDQWLPEKLAKQWKLMQSDPQIGLVHTDVLHLEQETGRTRRRPRVPGDFSGWCRAQLFRANGLTISSVLVRRACLGFGQAFDESLRYCEDIDLWLRLSPRIKFAFVDEPLVLYRLHGANMNNNELMMARGSLAVFRGLLASDSTLYRDVGRLCVHRRLADAAFRLGYACYDQGLHREGNWAFRLSLRHAPWRARTWAFCLATLLPAGFVGRLRALKQRFAPAQRAPATASPCTQNKLSAL